MDKSQSLMDIVDKIIELQKDIRVQILLSMEGNCLAAKRARVAQVEIEKLYKVYRKETIKIFDKRLEQKQVLK